MSDVTNMEHVCFVHANFEQKVPSIWNKWTFHTAYGDKYFSNGNVDDKCKGSFANIGRLSIWSSDLSKKVCFYPVNIKYMY